MDVKAAFEFVLRCLVFGEKMSDEGVVHTFSRLGFSPAVFGDFCRILSDPHSFFLSNVPSRLCNLVRNLHDGSWTHGFPSVVLVKFLCPKRAPEPATLWVTLSSCF